MLIATNCANFIEFNSCKIGEISGITICAAKPIKLSAAKEHERLIHWDNDPSLSPYKKLDAEVIA